jgi:hypothetical protein
MTGDVQLAAGGNVTVTESDNTITIASTIASGPRVVYGWANPATKTVTPSDAAVITPWAGKLWLQPIELFAVIPYIVVTPISSSAVTCTVVAPVSQAFVVDCWNVDGTPSTTSEYFFLMVGPS